MQSRIPSLVARPGLVSDYPFSLPLLWLLLAVSSIVFFEPAPYDLLGIGLLFIFFGLGLRIPAGIGYVAVLLGIFLFGNLISSLFADDPSSTWRANWIRFYMVATWLMFTSLVYENPQRVLPVLWSGYIFAAVMAVCIGLLGYFGFGALVEQVVEHADDAGGRVRALFKDPNVFGPFLVPVAIYSLAKLEATSSNAKFRFLGLFMLLVYGILISFSRGSWLNLGVSLLFYFILRLLTLRSARQKGRLLLVGATLAAISTMAFGWLISTEKTQLQLSQRAVLVQPYDIGEGGRFTNQLRVLQEGVANPIGIGPGQSDRHFGIAAHNLYLHVLIEAGWIGAFGFYAFVFLTLMKSFRFAFQPSEIQGVYIATLACTVGILVQSFFIDSTHWRHLYLLFAMLWGPLLASQQPHPAPRS
jgi:O-antigen ligase